MNNSPFEILLVEDDPNLSMVIQDYLEMLNYKTTLCKDGDEGLNKYHSKKFSLIILDVMMPKKDGFSVATEIRKNDTSTPIIFLTAKTLKDDRIKGFQLGCDDYIAKPFSTEELSLRIQAVLKRCYSGNGDLKYLDQQEFQIGNFRFDVENMLLIHEEVEVALTRKEAALFKLLCVYRDKLLSREIALKTVWGDDDYFIGRSMDVFISKLRKYLRHDPRISITNVHGTGFKLEVKEDL